MNALWYQMQNMAHWQKKNEGLSELKDSYVLEFMKLPSSYKEKYLRKQIGSHLKDFIPEFGILSFAGL